MCEIDYKTGIWQGNNMAPILFLYIMQAAIESLHMKLPCDKLEFCYFPDQKSSTCQYGRLSLQYQSQNQQKAMLSKLMTCYVWTMVLSSSQP